MEQKIIEILKEHIEGLENAEVCEDTQLIAKGLLESFDVITLIAGDMEKELPLMSKKEAAGCILDTILERM